MAKMNFGRSFRRLRASKEPEDLGFGTRLTGTNDRLINTDGTFNIERIGARGWNSYQSLVEMSWIRFFGVVVVFYLLVNAVFGLFYFWAGRDALAGTGEGSLVGTLAECFFFSVQTFTTVGYGALHPVGLASNLIASLNALAGLMSFALATGLFFARFSKPRAQFLFSNHALVAPYRDGWSFQFRIANKRNNHVINLQARMIMSWVEENRGERVRHYAPMPLEREQVSFFPLNWTVVHAIGQDSPLDKWKEKDLERINAEFLVLIEGYDESFAQVVHANRSYSWQEVLWRKRFRTMYFPGENGSTVLDLGLIDAVEEA